MVALYLVLPRVSWRSVIHLLTVHIHIKTRKRYMTSHSSKLYCSTPMSTMCTNDIEEAQRRAFLTVRQASRLTVSDDRTKALLNRIVDLWLSSLIQMTHCTEEVCTGH